MQMTSRHNFDLKLSEIRSETIRMGGIAGDMVKMAVEAALNGDLELAQTVINTDDQVDLLDELIHAQSIGVVATESPVASDLRFLAATLGVVGEIEKIADDAVKLARRATKLSGHFPVEMKRALQDMGESARHTFASVLRVYSQYDAELAKTVIDSDVQIDTQYVEARNKVFELIRNAPDDAEQLVRTIEAFHALEHVADHAVEVARRLQRLYAGVRTSDVGSVTDPD